MCSTRKMLQRPDGTGGLFISCPNIMLVITLLSTYHNNIVIKLQSKSKFGHQRVRRKTNNKHGEALVNHGTFALGKDLELHESSVGTYYIPS